MNEQVKYKEFTMGLVPGNKREMLGIPIPNLRVYAKEMVKDGTGESFLFNILFENKAVSYIALRFDKEREIKSLEDLYYEDIMLCAMIINLSNISLDERFNYCKAFVPLIDNWAVCDVFCCGAKWSLKSKALLWDFLAEYLRSNKEFELRFAIIMLMCYFLEEERIDIIFETLESIDVKLSLEGKNYYYVDMAIAWLLATAAAKLQDKTKAYWKKSRLSEKILKKAAQKMRDSRRVNFNGFL